MNNLNPEHLNSFHVVIRDTLKLFDDLISFENKKLDAIAANEVTILDQYMHDEQAYLMKMRSLDQKRENIQALLGMGGLPFREIIEKFDDSEKEVLQALYEELSTKTSELKDSIAATKRYIDLHLNAITTMIERLDGSGTTYDKSGEKEDPQSPPKRFTPTKA